MTGILKGWVIISLSLSRGWTASGEHSRGAGVGVSVNVGAGVKVSVSVATGVSVGGMLVEVGGKGMGEGVGAVEQEALTNRMIVNKTEYATLLTCCVSRLDVNPKAGLDFKCNFTSVGIGFFRVVQTRAQTEFAALLGAANVQGEYIFAAHRLDDVGGGNFIAIRTKEGNFYIRTLLKGGHFHKNARAQRTAIENRFGAQLGKAHLFGRGGHTTIPGWFQFGKEEAHVIGHLVIITKPGFSSKPGLSEIFYIQSILSDGIV